MFYVVTLVVFMYNCLSRDVLFGYPGRVHLQLLVPRWSMWLPWSCSLTTACISMLYLVTLVVFTYNCLSLDVIFGYPGRVHLQLFVPRCYIWLPWSCSLTTVCPSMLYFVTLVVFTYNCLSLDVLFGYPGRVHLQLLVSRCYIWLPWSCSLTTACLSMLYLVTLVVFTYNCLSLDVIFCYSRRVHLQLFVPRCYIWLPWSCSFTTACPSMLYLVTLVVFNYNCLSRDVIFCYPGRGNIKQLFPPWYIWFTRSW
jgi:hypothetical protein